MRSRTSQLGLLLYWSNPMANQQLLTAELLFSRSICRKLPTARKCNNISEHTQEILKERLNIQQRNARASISVTEGVRVMPHPQKDLEWQQTKVVSLSVAQRLSVEQMTAGTMYLHNRKFHKNIPPHGQCEQIMVQNK